MPNYLDLRWFLLVPALLSVCFLIWVFLNFSRDRARKHLRDAGLMLRRRDKNGIWE